MADAPKLLPKDKLREGYPKINHSIDNANEALRKSFQAEFNSNNAVSLVTSAELKVDNVQQQLHELVKEGDSSVEAAQARINRFGGSNPALTERIKYLENRINIKMPPFNAKGNGSIDDTEAIQSAIDYANVSGVKRVFVPEGDYLISNPIVLNGCTLEGVRANIFSNASSGSCFIAKTKDFIAVKQGSLSTKDNQFGISDIFVKDAQIGFEIVYVINSKFERLLAKDCDIGYKLGDLKSVGSMFCDFNSLYTRGTRIGAFIQAKEYWNNNVFNNGFISGTEKAVHLEVVGGYGALNNVFNNVEFRSPLGRGVELKNAINTTFNNTFFETGGNSIRTLDFCTLTLNDPIFGLFKSTNANGDGAFVFASGGIRLKLNGGTIFLTSENENTYFYDAKDAATHENIYVQNNIRTTGTASNFVRFKGFVNEIGYRKEEQITKTPTIAVEPSNYATLDFTFAKSFSKTPEVLSLTIRGDYNQATKLSYVLTKKSADGGSISLYNDSAGVKTVNFDVYAKVL